ncbi:MAG: DUF502 domain-containing protein [Pseudomonadota bacterium]
MLLALRKYLIAGLLIWVPILVTIWIVTFFIRLLDSGLKLLPTKYHPEILLGFNIPGFGLIFCLVVLFFTGMIATNYFGSQLVKLWDYIILKIPLVRSIYAAVKQIMETIFSSGSQAFRQVLLVEYPRRGSWSVAFQTSHACSAVNDQTGEQMIGVFIPTTPNPTSGFLIYVPKSEVRELDINVDEALKMVVSLGVVQPKSDMIHTAPVEKPQPQHR